MQNDDKNIEQKRDMERNIQTILLSVITAGTIALFGFMWNINGTIIQMRTESAFRYKSIEEATAMLQSIQLDLRRLDQRVQTLESDKQIKK